MESSETSLTPEFENMSPAESPVADSPPPQPVDTDILDGNTTFQPFDERSISADKVSGLILFAVLGVGAAVGLVFLIFAAGFGWIFWTVLASVAVVMLGLLYLALGWPAVEHRHRSWRLSDVGLEFRHGVWWKHRQAVPWARVQHADVSQGPLQRMYGIGTLTVHTAGTNDSAVNLAGLSHELAIELRDEIIRQRAANDVV